MVHQMHKEQQLLDNLWSLMDLLKKKLKMQSTAAGYRTGGRVGYKLGDFVGSGIFQPVSASMNAGDRPMMSGSGTGRNAFKS